MSEIAHPIIGNLFIIIYPMNWNFRLLVYSVKLDCNPNHSSQMHQRQPQYRQPVPSCSGISALAAYSISICSCRVRPAWCALVQIGSQVTVFGFWLTTRAPHTTHLRPGLLLLIRVKNSQRVRPPAPCLKKQATPNDTRPMVCSSPVTIKPGHVVPRWQNSLWMAALDPYY